MTFTRIISVFLSALIFLVLIVLPQVNFSDYAQSTISSKCLFFSFATLFISVILALRFIFQGRIRMCFSKVDLVLFLLVAYIILNRFYIQPEYGFSIRFIELLFLALFYFILRNLTVSKQIWLIIAITLSGTIQAIYGGLQLFDYFPSNHQGFKMTGSYFNPGPYAGVLAAIWPIALGIYFFKEKLYAYLSFPFFKNRQAANKGLEYLAIISLITIALVLPVAQSRAAWLSLIVSSVFLLECHYKYLRRSLIKLTAVKRTMLKVILVVLLSTVLFGFYNLKRNSSDGRLLIWKITTNIIKDYPINGVGFDRFKTHYMNYQAEFFYQNGESEEALLSDNSYYVFNEFLQFVSEQGLMGLLLLVGLVYHLLRIKISNEYWHIKRIVFAGLIAIAVFASFSYPMQILPIKLIMTVLLALLVQLDINKWEYQFSSRHIKIRLILSKVVISSLILFGLVKSISYLATTHKAFIDWKAATLSYSNGDLIGSIENYKKAYYLLKKEGDFLMNYGKALALAQKYEKAIVILQEAKQHLNNTIIETALGDAYKGLKEYDKAEKEYQNASFMIPVRFYPMYLLVLLYEESGQNDKLDCIAIDILKKDVKVPSTAIEKMKKEVELILIKTSGLK